MKKLIALLLAVMMLVGLVACASTAKTETPAETANTDTPAETTPLKRRTRLRPKPPRPITRSAFPSWS